jgi:iron complex transport system ATP-binding protein
MTVIAAMHDLNLAARYFPRLVLFQRGVVADSGPAEVLEPHLLKRVYGIEVQVGILRGAEHLSVLPPGVVELEDKSEQVPLPKVFVMAGGGSGERLMRALADARIPFIAGALNIGDSDHTLALRLANEVITEQPYSPISPETLDLIGTNLSAAKLLIVCPMPVGSGNLALLQEAYKAALQGIEVLLLVPTLTTTSTFGKEQPASDRTYTIDELLLQTGIANRDYTNGEAMKLVRGLLQTGAIVVQSVTEVIDAVKKAS